MRTGRFLRASVSLSALCALCATFLTLIVLSGPAASQTVPRMREPPLRLAPAPNPPFLIAPPADAVVNAPSGFPSLLLRWEPPRAGARIDFYRLTFENLDNPAAPPVRRPDIPASGGQIQTSQILPPALQPAAGRNARIRWSVRACNNESVLQRVGAEPGNCSQPASRVLVWSRPAPRSGGSAGASSSPRSFRQFVIANARLREDIPSPADFVVQVRRSTDRTTWSAPTLSDGLLFLGPTNIDSINGPPEDCGTAIKPSMGSSPGIGSNGRFYVLAFWGRPQRAGSETAASAQMFVATSQDGASWTWPVRVHTTARVWNSSAGMHRSLGRYVVPAAGISVASQGLDGPWFASYADAAGAINVVALPIRPSDGAVVNFSDCDAGISSVLTPSPVAVIAGATTDVAPALAHRESRLVLGWQTQGQIRLLTTPNGRTWPQAGLSTLATERTSGQPLTSTTNSAPFLHFSTGPSLFLTLTQSLTFSRYGEPLFSGRLRVLSSSDGVSFTQIAEHSVPDADMFGSSIAGRAGAFVVAYPSYTGGGRRTALFGPGIEQEIQTDTPYRVTIALGP